MNGKILVVLAALIGAFTVVFVTTSGIIGPTIAGGAGFAILLWILAFSNVLRKVRHNNYNK